MYIVKDCSPARSRIGIYQLSRTPSVARARAGRSLGENGPLYLTNIQQTMLELGQPLALAVSRRFLPLELALFIKAAKLENDLQLVSDLVFCSTINQTEKDAGIVVPGFIIEGAKDDKKTSSPHTFNQEEIDNLTGAFLPKPFTSLFINCTEDDGSFTSDLTLFQRIVFLLGHLKAQASIALIGLEPKDASFGLKSYLAAKYETTVAKNLLTFLSKRGLETTTTEMLQIEKIKSEWLPAIKARLDSNAPLIPGHEAPYLLQSTATDTVN
jgi:hypothetical protein